MFVKAAIAFSVCVVACLFLQKDEKNDFSDIEKMAYQDVPDIIKSYGYLVEEHTVTTADGYLIGVHRIPRGNVDNVSLKGPVLLLHGFLGSSADYVLMGPGQSLAFLLADAGYDVWMGNMRGNYYSIKHVNLSSDDPEFWNFGLHEISVYDIPAMTDYVLQHTHYNQIVYIGFSFGGAVPFILLSSKPDYNFKIKTIFALSPAPYLADSQEFPLLSKSFFIGSHKLQKVYEYLGIHGLLLRQQLFADLAGLLCSSESIFQPICMNIVELITGTYEKNVNKSLMPAILGHMPSGASRQSFAHVGQSILSGDFLHFDYGEKNMDYYGTKSPPKYNLENFNTEAIFYCGTSDLIVPCKKVEHLFSQLSHVKEKKFFMLNDTSHFDFNYGTHIKELLYEGILDILE